MTIRNLRVMMHRRWLKSGGGSKTSERPGRSVRLGWAIRFYFPMRSCNYCGRGALGDEPNCRECGKSLTEAASKPPPLEWIPVEREESQQTQQLTTRRKLGWLLILGSLAILGGTYVFARNSPGGGYFIVPTGALALGLYFLQRPALMSSDGKLSLTLGDLMAKAGPWKALIAIVHSRSTRRSRGAIPARPKGRKQPGILQCCGSDPTCRRSETYECRPLVGTIRDKPGILLNATHLTLVFGKGVFLPCSSSALRVVGLC